jgi:endoglycosylceramidase
MTVAAGFGCGSEDKGTPTCELTSAPLSTLKITVDGTRILDAQGREIILRGVNTGGRSKFPPFFPFPFQESGLPEQASAPPFEDALDLYLDRVESWGHNVLRLPFTWEAVEPTEAAYDATYLGRYTAVVDGAAARGLRVIVDFHQDVFARPYCGDGFPLWTLEQPVPDPPANCENWFMGYMTNDDVKNAFDRLWSNTDGLMDKLKDMWRHVASELWPRDNVIGFEIINEPGAGTAQEDVWAPTVLTPFYSEMVTVIKENAPDAPIFFDSTGTSALDAQTALERPTGEGLVFAPHYYDSEVIMFGTWSGLTTVLEPIGRWRAKADGWGIPVLLGEFGIRPHTDNAAQYVRLNFDALDEHLMHGAIWEYSSTVDDWNNENMSLVDGDGQERETVVEIIRAYPAAVAGRITSFFYDAENRSGTLTFEAQADGLTEIAAPTRLYPDGATVRVTGVDACWAYDIAAQRLLVQTKEAGTATVTFSPTD